MRIAITGATGLIGSLTTRTLTREHHTVLRVVRALPRGPEDIQWDPERPWIDTFRLRGAEAVVHLAGESISGRWNEKKKQRIRDSREKGTKLIAETLAAMDPKPKVLVSASATGFYGDGGAKSLTESSPSGNDFLSGVCRAWEAATAAAREAGIRVVNLRFGVVLSAAGGALPQMLPPFEAGVGGRLGSGKQYMSWISVRDAVGAIHRALVDDRLEGPVNVVAPNPVTNAYFTKALGQALGKRTLFPVPKLAIKVMFGEMGEALLLGSQRVEPAKLKEVGYAFQDPELHALLAELVRE